PGLAHAIEALRWVDSHRAAARTAAMAAAERLRANYAPARIGDSAKRRLMELLTRTDPARASQFAAVDRQQLAPTPPISGAWYDADYFENGLKSNWTGGYTWPLFRGVFKDAAGYLP